MTMTSTAKVASNANVKTHPSVSTNGKNQQANGKRPKLRDPEPLVVNKKEYVEAPDGGWGWVVVAAVWLCNVLVLGMLKSFGVLFPAFRDYFHGSAGAISWINSISLSMRATAAPVSAALSNRFGERKIVALGGVLTTLGLIISYFATSPYYLYASMGCIAGIGFAFASLPALTMIGRYFKVKRSLANGLSRSGGGATFFLAPLLQFLVGRYGWQGCLLIVAGLELHLIACALLFRPIRLKEELEFDKQKTFHQHRMSLLPEQTTGEDGIYKPSGIVAKRAISERQRVKKLQSDIERRVQEYGVTESLIVDHFPTIEPVYQPKKKRFLDFSLLKNPAWIVITTNLVLTQMAYSTTLVHIVARAKTMDVGEYESAMLLSIIGLCEVIVILGTGPIADKGYIRRIHLHKIYISVMALATFCSLFANSFLALSIYCVVFGCGSGGWQGNILPVTVDTLGVRKLRSAYGFCLFFSGACGQMVGPPLGGFIYDTYGSYTPSFILVTICLVAAVLVLWLEIPATKYVEKRNIKKMEREKDDDEEDYEVLLQEMNGIL